MVVMEISRGKCKLTRTSRMNNNKKKIVKSQGICIVNSALVKSSLPEPMNRLLSNRMLPITRISLSHLITF